MFIRSLSILLWAFAPGLLSGADLDCVQVYFGTNGNPGGVRQIIGGREGVAFLRTNRGWEELRRKWQRAMGPWDPEIPGPLDAESLAGLRVLDAGTGEGALVEDLRAVGIDAVGIDLALSPTQKEKPYFFCRRHAQHGICRK